MRIQKSKPYSLKLRKLTGTETAANSRNSKRANYCPPISIAQGWRTGEARDKKARWQPEELTDVIADLVARSPKAQKVYGT